MCKDQVGGGGALTAVASPSSVVQAQFPFHGELCWGQASTNCVYAATAPLFPTAPAQPQVPTRGELHPGCEDQRETVTMQIQVAGAEFQCSSLWAGSCTHAQLRNVGLGEAVVV